MRKSLLILLLLLTAVVSRAHDFEVDGIYYNITSAEEQTVAVTYKGTSYYDYKERYSDNVVIPESVTYSDVTYKVTEIGVNAFYNCYILTSVTIPDGVTRIGESAFEACYKLTSVTIPKSVVVLEKRAFSKCERITSVTIPDGVTLIVESVFSGCKALTSISIPNSVYMIGQNAFNDCSGLTSLIIPNSVTVIGESAFLGCTGLENIVVDADNPFYDSRSNCNAIIETSSNTLINGCKNTVIPNNVTAIGDRAFCGLETLTSVIIPNNVTTIGEGAFYYCTGLTSVTLSDGVASIGEIAFYHCNGLTAITIPNSVTEIGYNAFYGCNFTSVHIPGSVTTIGDGAFSGYSGLENIVVDASNPVYDSRDNCNAIMETSSNKLVQGCKNTIIPNEVTAIGADAFSGCSALTAITIPDGVTEIGKGAFYGCSSLIAVTIPDGVTEIGYSTFGNCKKLSFVSIPSSVTTIGDYAFYQCNALLDFYCFAVNVPSAEYDTFRGLRFTTLYVPSVSLQEYKNSTSISRGPWNNFRNVIAIGSTGDTFIVDGICYEITSDEELTVAVTSKSYIVYSGDVVIPESVTYLGQTYSVTSVGNAAFYNCPDLTSVSIPNSVTEIGYNAFYSCRGLTSVAIPNSVTYIKESAFYGCTGLTSVSIGQASSSIPGSAIEIDRMAFAGCTALKSVTFDKSMTNIKVSAFYNCTGLATVTFGSDVTEIVGESGAFSKCSSLKDFYCLAESVPTTDRIVLPKMGVTLSSLTLHVPAISLEAYRNADIWKNFGQIVAIDEGDGIEQPTSEAFTNQNAYDLNGRRTTKTQKGINLLRDADGRVKKVVRRN